MKVEQHGMTFDINPQDHSLDKTFSVLVVESDPESIIVFRDTIETLTGHSVEVLIESGVALATRDDIAQWLAFEVLNYL